MTKSEILSLVLSILSGVLGGVVVTIVNYFLNKNKTNAEIGKIKAETDLIIAETNAKTASNMDSLSASLIYKLDNATEQVIYDSATKGKYQPFVGTEGRFWSSKENQYVGPKGLGKLTPEESKKDGLILNIQRTNTDGRFAVELKQYKYNGEEHDCIPKSDLIAGKRKIRIRCEAKVNTDNVEHTLVFILRNKATKIWLASRKEKVTRTDEWTFIEAFFEVTPTADLQFRIDDQDVSKAPSGVQIRKFLLTEKIPTK